MKATTAAVFATVLVLCVLSLARNTACAKDTEKASGRSEKVFVVGHKSPDTDSIASAIGYAYLMRSSGVNAVAGRAGEINRETEYALDYFGAARPEAVSSPKQIILIDHNEPDQSVDGLEIGNIVGIVDHHRLGCLELPRPIDVLIRPFGCCATIVANAFQERHVAIPKDIAGMLLSAIISDTLLFRSPTCTDTDRETAEKLAEIAGVDITEYGMAMLKAGTCIDGMTPEQIVNTDIKIFSFGNVRATVSYIQVTNTEDILKDRSAIVSAMNTKAASVGASLALMMVTDILKFDTWLLLSGEPIGLVEKAFGRQVENDVIYLPGVVSRKKQIIPPLSEAAKTEK